jgi:hypothetical protein
MDGVNREHYQLDLMIKSFPIHWTSIPNLNFLFKSSKTFDEEISGQISAG